LRVDHRLQAGGQALEVRDQALDATPWRMASHRANRCRPVRRAAVREIVTIDRRDHDVLEPERRDRTPDAVRLVAILPGRLPVRDRAVAAVPRADVAQDHERGRRFFPALADVGAVRLLADGVQVEPAQEPFELHVSGPAGRADLEPRGLSALGPTGGIRSRLNDWK